MKLILFAVILSILLTSIVLPQSKTVPLERYDAASYRIISDTTIVTITTAKGETITLQILPSTYLAVYYSNSETKQHKPDAFSMFREIQSREKDIHGSLSVRTKPIADSRTSPNMDDEMNAVPLRMDFADAKLNFHKKM